MFTVVTGGSGSGKSEFSENYLLRLDEQTGGNRERFYIATMFPYDEESHRRIARHRAMRRDKGFQTLECYTGLKDLEIPERNGRKSAVLLECMSNLAANEYYREEGAGPNCAGEIIEGIRRLRAQSAHLVVVTNEVFSDGIFYDRSVEDYIRVLGQINRQMAALCDTFAEVVYTIPVCHKGELI